MKIFLVIHKHSKAWSLDVKGHFHRSANNPALIYDNGNKYYYLYGAAYK